MSCSGWGRSPPHQLDQVTFSSATRPDPSWIGEPAEVLADALEAADIELTVADEVAEGLAPPPAGFTTLERGRGHGRQDWQRALGTRC